MWLIPSVMWSPQFPMYLIFISFDWPKLILLIKIRVNTVKRVLIVFAINWGDSFSKCNNYYSLLSKVITRIVGVVCLAEHSIFNRYSFLRSGDPVTVLYNFWIWILIFRKGVVEVFNPIYSSNTCLVVHCPHAIPHPCEGTVLRLQNHLLLWCYG